jgi:CHAT domain
MAASSPAIRITVRVGDEDTFVLSLSSPPHSTLEVRTNLNSINLTEFKKKIYDGLNTVRRWCGPTLKLEIGLSCEILRKLISVGGGISSQLFRTAEDRFAIQDFFRRACPAWLRSGTDGYCPPLVQIASSMENSIPLEFLPIFDAEPPPPSNTIQGLSEMCSRFPAFSSVVHRSLFEAVGGASEIELNNVDKLRVRVFQHAGVKAAQAGYKLLSAVSTLEVLGPWPEARLMQKQFVQDLATQLWNGSGLPEAEPAFSRDHIHHFACHCDTEQPNSDSYSLCLAHKGNNLFSWQNERWATLKELHEAIAGFKRRTSTEIGPLVFLNACGGSRMTPNGVTSFPRFFLNNNNCGVIGTETPIPDTFATMFADEFYKTLMQGQKTGGALFTARWSLLKRHNNPLGILYSAYGNPDVHIRKGCSV